MVFTAGRGRARQIRMGPSCLAANAMPGGSSPVLKILVSNLCPVSFPTVRSHSSPCSSSSLSLLAQALGILSRPQVQFIYVNTCPVFHIIDFLRILGVRILRSSKK